MRTDAFCISVKLLPTPCLEVRPDYMTLVLPSCLIWLKAAPT